MRFLGVSILLLVPCYWHREIIADDLGSHLYNAWLAHLIRHGEAPGLWIGHQWTNVLFDLLLSGLGALFGFHASAKICVSLAVLIFFWGVFALVAAATRRAPWYLAPCIAFFAYGWTFHMGLFNYYLAIGLSFFGLAIFWRGRGWERAVTIVIAPVVAMAHPLGVIFLVAACAYVAIAEATRGWRQVALLLGTALAIFVVDILLWNLFPADPATKPFYLFNGADQLFLYGGRYRIPEFAFLAFAIGSIAVDIVRHRGERGFWRPYNISAQLYALAIFSAWLLPGAVSFSKASAPIALLTERVTSVSAALVCCLLGAMRPSKWHLAGFAALGAVFFSFAYQDTAKFSRMEQQIVRLVSALPPNQRVLGTVQPPPDSRVMIQHILDRACIGRCFSYGNYEPSSNVFWIHAKPGNPYVIANYDQATSTEEGTYVVQPQDLPVYQVYQCSETGTDICIRPLVAGEKNDRLGSYLPED